MAAEQEGFAEFAAVRWGNLVRSAVFLGCTLAEAQDMAQTTLIRCYLAWPRVEAARDRDGYVYKMLVNCLRDSRRRLWWGETPTNSFPELASEDPTAGVDVSDAVHRALAGLSKRNREVVVLRHLAGLSEAQTAHALGIAVGTVKSRSSRGLAELAASSHLSDLSGGTSHER